MVSKAAEGPGKNTFEEMNCYENGDEFNILPWEIKNVRRKNALKIEIQPEIVSFEDFNVFSVLIGDVDVDGDCMKT